ncbi:hypothetical protein [Vibrio ouci]|nr:hypothetical protein [Vibrio ouci]
MAHPINGLPVDVSDTHEYNIILSDHVISHERVSSNVSGITVVY